MKTTDSMGRPIPKGFGGKEVGKLGGRPKGSRDKATLSVKAAIHQTFTLMGGVPCLLRWAKENETLFFTRVLPRLLPLEVTGPNGSAIIVEKIIREWVSIAQPALPPPIDAEFTPVRKPNGSNGHSP